MGSTGAPGDDRLAALYFNPAALAGGGFAVTVATGAAALTTPSGPSWDPAGQLQQIQRLLDRPDTTATPLAARLSTMAGIGWQGSALALMGQGTARVEDGPSGLWGQVRVLSAIGLGAGWQVDAPWLPARGLEGFVGTALRVLQVRQARKETGDAAWQALTGYGYASDLGLLVRWRRFLELGLAARDAAGSVAWQGAGGASVGTTSWLFPAEGLTVDVALIGPPVAAARWQGDGSWGVGVEQPVFGGVVALRAGYRKDAVLGRASSAGVGLRAGPVRADVAVVIPETGSDLTLTAGAGLKF
ncbi:hypothetical protein U7230_02255 [Carboxydochorda subterranea]|uniref:Uncharacterized protein n=1 Tax=Carboxydichorda subterranea TaxID=3109565 RepID=A0ABZ1BYR0_9FIRM|nr:hypothetical protein [Limnochorda sp. L945t]WRP17856.1 hypothetical protein U7230_02255 [Limnochorda sp. L945t]